MNDLLNTAFGEEALTSNLDVFDAFMQEDPKFHFAICKTHSLALNVFPTENQKWEFRNRKCLNASDSREWHLRLAWKQSSSSWYKEKSSTIYEQGLKRMTHNARGWRGMASRKGSTSFGDSSKKKIKENQRNKKEKQQKHLFQ